MRHGTRAWSDLIDDPPAPWWRGWQRGGGISQGIPPYLILVLPQVAAGADRRLVLPQVAAGMQPQDVNCNNGKKPLTRCLLPLRGWAAGNGAAPD